jgi:HAMP domain-containing protein/two-component sensor histidine kinase/HPt (histidine-containing phosphotransfer) domain-containing protein
VKLNFNRISFKLLAVCLSFSLPITVMLSLMVKAKQKDIDFADWEIKGDRYQRPLAHLMQDVARHRLLSLRQLLGDGNLAQELAPVRAAAKKHIAELSSIDAELAEDLQFTTEGLGKRNRLQFTASGFAKLWTALLATPPSTIEASEKQHRELIAHLRTMITHAGDTSNLILDPDLDSYYLMDVSLLALPQLQDRLQEIESFVERTARQPALSAADRLQAGVYAAFLKEADLDRVSASSQTSLNEDQNFYGISSSLQMKLTDGNVQHAAAVTPVIEALRALAAVSESSGFDLAAFRVKAARAAEEAYAYHHTTFDEMDKLLSTRIGVIRASLQEAVVWTLLSLLASSALAFVITINLIRRVRRFNDTTKRIAEGDMAARVHMSSGDEIGELARSFDRMTDRIGTLNAEIAAKNTELQGINSSLEQIVAERTATIKTILDNVKFGFLLIDRNLNVQEGFSKSCQELLGSELVAGRPFLDATGLGATRSGPLFKEFLSQAFEDMLPEEMTLHQLPSRMQVGPRILSLVASSVRTASGAVGSVLFTIIDATNLEMAERENHRHKVLVRLLKEFDSFRDFIDETRQRLVACRAALGRNEQAKVRGELHTMKGNTSAYDMIDIAKLIHEVEDAPIIGTPDVDRIEAAFIGFLEQNFDVLQLDWAGDGDESYVVYQNDINQFLDRVRETHGVDGLATRELAAWAERIQYKSARSLVGALPDYGERLANRLGKQVKVRVEGGDVRMNPEVMRPIMQSLVHLVRNSIDHGIEMAHERAAKGEFGEIRIDCQEGDDEWSIVVSDDGRGIDAMRLGDKAISQGLITREQFLVMPIEQRLQLVFLSGVSTAETISDVSGRGVGMSAVQAAVDEAGGGLTIESQIGKGTVVRINVPKRRLARKKVRMAA